VKEGKIEDTAEHLIISFPNDFPSDVVQSAQNRIDKAKTAADFMRNQGHTA
jgi:hypothetical protein